LEYSHRAGIVHRDIKPGNVMITGSGEVKVMDFGIARSLADSGVTLTQTAAVVGTAQYISPEQARGEQADARSDLYATGCVLYEMLTGRPPFVGESLVSVAVSHVREMPTPPSALEPSLPRDIDAIVMKSLAKDRLERYQSAFEMRADLERAAAGLPVAAAHDTAAATQLIAAPVGYDSYGTVADLDQVEDVGEPEPRGMSWGRLVLIALAILAVAGIIGYLLFRGGDDGAQQVGVPNIVGEPVESAQQLIEDRGLVMGTPVEQETDNPDEVGIVLSQDPAFNELVDEGSTVTPTIGVAPTTVAVPADLVGMTEEEARAALQAAGLTVGTVSQQENDDAEPGEVLETDPASGEDVPVGSAVNLVVAEASDTVTVPSVLGRPVDDARAAIEAAGLSFGNVTREASDQPVDTVLRTDPSGGTEVARGSTVSVVISSGPANVQVPDVVGDDVAAAQATLEKAGLQVSIQMEDNCEAEEGSVMGQSPPAGTEVDPASTVEITVAQRPDDCP
jgi:beta-lactam-binding protein with PASTA domain